MAVEPGEDSVVLTLPGGIRVKLPRPIRNLTTFVLREQGDWFEQEMDFLRRWLKPGMKVIDIGANYGVYTLSMAKAVGPRGHVWAFEPAATTADYLAASVAENDFANVTLHRQGLSDRVGEAAFHVSANAELSSLNPATPSGQVETIVLTTLDRCRHECGWNGIDFIKLDAEGEEARIVSAGQDLLQQESPLIMLELKHAKQINLPLLDGLRELGYRLFRLLPGPGALVPFDPEQHFDPYLLNLFAAREDRIRSMEAEGVLVAELVAPDLDVTGRARRYLDQCPFNERIPPPRWLKARDDGTGMEVLLNYYAASLDPSLAIGQRVACLRRAMRMTLTGNGLRVPPMESAAVNARVAADLGQRNHAVKILVNAIRGNKSVSRMNPRMPFLPACARYDSIDPGDHVNQWLAASILEKWVVEHAYSSYFTARKALGALQRIEQLGFADMAMKRRLQLVSGLRTGGESG